MNSDSEAVKEVLNVLFSHLEKLETQTEAMMRFMKEKQKVTDKQFAPYLEQAGKASDVRWRAARARIEYLIAGALREQNGGNEKRPEIAADDNETRKSDITEDSGMEIAAKNPPTNEQEVAKEPGAQKVQQPAETKDREAVDVDRDGSRKEADIQPEQTPEAVATKETPDSSVTDKKGDREAA